MQRIKDWWYAKFFDDTIEEPDYENIRGWKIIWCKLIGHIEFDIEMGEHWISGDVIVADYNLLCGRCGRWLE